MLTEPQITKFREYLENVLNVGKHARIYPEIPRVQLLESSAAIIDALLTEVERLSDQRVREGAGESVVIPAGLRLASLLKWLRDHAGCGAVVFGVSGFSVRCDKHEEEYK